MAGERTLIVDDNRTTTNVMRLYLESFGFVVPDIACSGTQSNGKNKKNKS